MTQKGIIDGTRCFGILAELPRPLTAGPRRRACEIANRALECAYQSRTVPSEQNWNDLIASQSIQLGELAPPTHHVANIRHPSTKNTSVLPKPDAPTYQRHLLGPGL